LAAFFICIYLYTMNINKIFNLFLSSEDEPKNVEPQKDLFENPIVWIGMFKKMIFNHNVFSKQMIAFFNTSDPPLDVNDIEKASNLMVYERAFEQLAKLNLTDPSHIDSLRLYSDETFKMALDSTLNFFLNLEEYEKCAFVKKVQDLTNTF